MDVDWVVMFVVRIACVLGVRGHEVCIQNLFIDVRLRQGAVLVRTEAWWEGGMGDFRVSCVKGCLVECVRVWCARSYCFVRGVYRGAAIVRLMVVRGVYRGAAIVRLMDGDMECPGRSVRVYVEEFVFGTCSRSCNIVIAVSSSNTIQF